MTMPYVDVAFCNAFVNNRHRRALRKQLAGTKALVICLAEGQRITSIPGYVRFAPPAGVTKHASETPVFLRADVAHEVRLVGIHKATLNTGHGFAHDRWIVEVRFSWNGYRFAVINTHANPSGFQGSSNPGAPQNRRLLTLWHSLVGRAQDAGYRVITTADWNAQPPFIGHEHARSGLDYVVDDTPPPGRDLIDGIGFDEHRLLLKDFTVLPAIGTDGMHKLLIARLEVTEP